METYYSTRTRPLFRGTQIVWYVVGLIEALLAFRFLLRILAANPTAGFTDIIYTLTAPLVAPFAAVFPAARMEGSVFEWSTLLAMVVYWLLGVAISRLFVMGKPVSTPEATYKLEEQE